MLEAHYARKRRAGAEGDHEFQGSQGKDLWSGNLVSTGAADELKVTAELSLIKISLRDMCTCIFVTDVVMHPIDDAAEERQPGRHGFCQETEASQTRLSLLREERPVLIREKAISSVFLKRERLASA